MTNAQTKNELALARIMDGSLKARIESTRIGIWSEPSEIAKSGVLIAEALGEVLGRFWRNIEICGTLAPTFIKSANSAALSGGQPELASEAWNPPYDFVISIGCELPEGIGPGIRIGASGWDTMAGPSAIVTDDPNPVGPAAIAAIAAAEVFKKIFSDGLGDKVKPLPEEFKWTVWGFGKESSSPAITSLNLDDVHIFGTGAVTHGMLWLLERWPAEVTGALHLIDQDHYDFSNGQRYIGMQHEDVLKSKAEQTSGRLKQRHKELKIHAHNIDLNQYYDQERPDCNVRLAVIGVDSKEHRRHLALKLPLRIINMWTEAEYLGAARFGFDNGWPCPFCVYPEDNTEPKDETAQIAIETGLKPARIRKLLYSGEGLTQSDIDVIVQRYAISNSQNLLNKPLRSIRGTLCATGRIKLPESNEDADIPFAFSSLLAGLGGFMELLHELLEFNSEPGHWQYRVFSYPTAYNWNSRGPKPNCYLCSEEMVKKIVADKYI